MIEKIGSHARNNKIYDHYVDTTTGDMFYLDLESPNTSFVEACYNEDGTLNLDLAAQILRTSDINLISQPLPDICDAESTDKGFDIQSHRIITECKYNPWYFIRRLAKVRFQKYMLSIVDVLYGISEDYHLDSDSVENFFRFSLALNMYHFQFTAGFRGIDIVSKNLTRAEIGLDINNPADILGEIIPSCMVVKNIVHTHINNGIHLENKAAGARFDILAVKWKDSSEVDRIFCGRSLDVAFGIGIGVPSDRVYTTIAAGKASRSSRISGVIYA